MKIPKEVRDQFEDYAWRQYESARMSQALQGAKVHAKLDRAAYLERKGDEYVNEATAMLWIGWKLCLDAQAPTLEAANMWREWAEQQDRVDAELPEGYALALVMEKGWFYVALSHEDEREVDYEDPADLESPGSLFRIIDSALAAAKADNAARLN